MLALFPEVIMASEQKDFEKLSIIMRRYFSGLKDGAPAINMQQLLAKFGISFGYLSMDGFGVVGVRDEAGKAQCSIAICKGLELAEEAFLIAHLFGHFVLHIQPKIARTEWRSGGFKEIELPLTRYTRSGFKSLRRESLGVEEEADLFAASLLLPKAMFIRACERLPGQTSRIASLFETTPEVITRRLRDFDVVSELMESSTDQGASHLPNAMLQATQLDVVTDDTRHMTRESHHPAPVISKTQVKVSYGKSEATNAHEKNAQTIKEQGSTDMQADGKLGQQLRGMDRIREIAKMLDKSGRMP
jgi:Zn-dependent peptidase ImmA (M78 family)